MSSRKTLIVVLALVLVLVLAGGGGWIAWQKLGSSLAGPQGLMGPQGQPNATAGVTVEKLPLDFTSRTFDPNNPPADMPPLDPGEVAECDATYSSMAAVAGTMEQTDATNALATVKKVKVTLGLKITIWVPAGASQQVIEHEDGHRQIAEYYYQTADQLAERIAAGTMGRQTLITGSDLNAELNKTLEQASKEITEQYNQELDPGPAQTRYDTITDHSRNPMASKDAVAQTLKESADAAQPAANPGN